MMNIKKAFAVCLILMVVFFLDHSVVFALNGSNMIDGQLESIDLGDMKKVIGSSQKAYNIDLEDLLKKALAGELDFSFSGIFKGSLKIIFSEFYNNADILRNLIVISIASAILKNLTDSFENKSVGEMGFYISYIALVLILFSSFRVAAGILEDLVLTVAEFVNAAIPLFTSLVIMTGNITGGYVFNTILVFAANIVTNMVNGYIAPAITIIATLQTVNYLTENETLTNFSQLLKNIISWILKILAIVLVSIISIQKISTPLLNNIALKTAKSAINVVPVVGEVLTGAVESVMYWGSALKSGVLVVVILAMVSICVVPVVKLGVLIIIYKLTAAIIQPICDKRIVNCINSIGDYTALLLSAGTIVSLMFLISSMIILSF